MSTHHDFITLAVHDAFLNGASDKSTWFVTFTDGESRIGTLRHLSEDAFVLSGKVVYYFSSSQVIRLNIKGKE